MVNVCALAEQKRQTAGAFAFSTLSTCVVCCIKHMHMCGACIRSRMCVCVMSMRTGGACAMGYVRAVYELFIRYAYALDRSSRARTPAQHIINTPIMHHANIMNMLCVLFAFHPPSPCPCRSCSSHMVCTGY